MRQWNYNKKKKWNYNEKRKNKKLGAVVKTMPLAAFFGASCDLFLFFPGEEECVWPDQYPCPSPAVGGLAFFCHRWLGEFLGFSSHSCLEKADFTWIFDWNHSVAITVTSHTFSVGVEDINAQGLGACSSGKGFLCIRFSACFLFHFSHSRLKQSCTAFWKLKSTGWLNIRQKALIFMYALSAHLDIFHSTLAHPVHAQASAWLQSRSCSCWNQWGVTTRDRIHWLRIAHKFMKFWELPAVSH